MHTVTTDYALSGWRGEFVNAATEHAFRKHSEVESARSLRRALLVWAAMVVLFGLIDYPVLGHGYDFQLLFGWRLATASLLLLLYWRLRRNPSLVSDGYAATAAEVFGSVLFFMLYFLRHDMVSWVIGVVAIALLALFMFIPNRVYLSLLAAAFLSGGMMVCVAARGMGTDKVIGLGFILALPTAVGFFTALRWQLAQRRQYALLMQVISSNRELQDEIKRREALEAELKRQATTDPLTGLFNRRQYEMLFQRERERCARLGQEMTLCVMDLDHFKRVNDQHGHDAGDAVLKHVAQHLSCALRHSDIVGRFGGEEFILILPDTGLEQAVSVLNRLREELAQTPVPVRGQLLPVSATFGVTMVQPDDTDLEVTIRRADVALYEGKGAGRNRVMTA
ncbi:MAG: GGDEF domain-containing protein [Pseudomonadaceae bacterium]